MFQFPGMFSLELSTSHTVAESYFPACLALWCAIGGAEGTQCPTTPEPSSSPSAPFLKEAFHPETSSVPSVMLNRGRSA